MALISEYRMDEKVQDWNFVKGKNSRSAGFGSETLTADIQLDRNSPRFIHAVAHDGVDAIKMPDCGLFRDEWFRFFNDDAVKVLVIQEMDGTPLATVATSESRWLVSNGTTWVIMV